ncbi:hypothetical protein OB919_21185 [Halobacteria archaeon AArc-curdl1]|uniref:DUF7978 domain-containing protein n=1 Tax=Natronosalvus hydrolyticus TaxID=2979988 RepID=A0AAP2ZCG7_9EURY|nr:hypothetical protein [Halobacteria archaeon AArc-curdl1]
MSLDRRLEYEPAPSSAADTTAESKQETSDSSDGYDLSVLKPGAVVGLGIFTVAYLVSYQFVIASGGGVADGGVAGGEDGPARWTLAGFLLLLVNGGTFIQESERLLYPGDVLFLFGSMIFVPVLVVIFLSAGWLVVRILEPQDLQSTVKGAAAAVPSYLVLIALGTQLFSYTPEGEEGPWAEFDSIAVTLDSTLVVTSAVFSFTFICLGAVIANRAVLFGSNEDRQPPTGPGIAAVSQLGDVEAAGTADHTVTDTDSSHRRSANADETRRSGSMRASESNPTESAEVSTESGSIDDHERYRPSDR